MAMFMVCFNIFARVSCPEHRAAAAANCDSETEILHFCGAPLHPTLGLFAELMLVNLGDLVLALTLKTSGR